MTKQLSLFQDDPDDGRPHLSPAERTLVAKAIWCLEAKYLVMTDALTSPKETREYLKLRLCGRTYEVFACLFLDNRHRVIRYEELFLLCYLSQGSDYMGIIDRGKYPLFIIESGFKFAALIVTL